MHPTASQPTSDLAGACALFDLDGLLIDSEPLWQDAEMAVLGRLGVALTRADCASTMGWRIDAVMDHWYKLRGWTGPQPAEVVEQVVDEVERLMRARGTALPGVAHALTLCKSLGLRLAVASSSRSRLIRAALETLGIAAQFEVVQSAEDQTWGKPHPGVFLAAAAALGVPAQRCVVLEDSPPGILAAKAAGMGCIAVPSAHSQDLRGLAIADVTLTSLQQLDIHGLRAALRPVGVAVRVAGPADWAGIDATVRAAFGRSDEADLVAALRRDGATAGEWVAELGGRVVGHVLYTRLVLADFPEVRLLAVAPLSVDPSQRRGGVADAVVRRSLCAQRLAGVDGVVVLGDPAVWGRFGFEAAAAAHLHCPFSGPHLQALALSKPEWPAAWSGTLRYALAFLSSG